MVYIKIALSYPRFQFSFQGAFDTVEVLRKPPAASSTPRRATAGPAPFPFTLEPTKKLRAFMHRARRRPRRPAFGFLIRSCPYELP